jgi:anti-sigma factor RsiW
MNHEEIRELLEAFALGVLDPAERAAVEEHLVSCESCRRTVAEYAAIADALPGALAAAAPEGPDPALRARLLRRVGRPRQTLRLSMIAAALTSALAVVVLVWATQLSQTLAAERAIYAQLAGQQEIVFEVVDSPKTSRVVLRPPVSGSTAYGKVFTRTDLPFVVAMAGRLPAPPHGQQYYVWLERDGETILAGTLPIDGQGFGALVYDSDRNGPTFRSVRVTLQAPGATEPAGVPALIWVAPTGS